MMQLKMDHTISEWDALLAHHGGHPLQSALWGEAKKTIYGITDHRIGVYNQEKLIALVRIENRGIKPFAKVGWMPQGPTIYCENTWKEVQVPFLRELKKLGYSACVNYPWQKARAAVGSKLRQTAWVNLIDKKQKLWSILGYGVRKSLKADAEIVGSPTVKEVADFYNLCISISCKKEFDFQYSNQYLQYLLQTSKNENVEAKLFVVKLQNKVVAGAFILRVGTSGHYMFGAVDRQYSKYRFGEYVQWGVIEWLLQKKCTLYDLEGIDEIKNPGVASFKKKLGGDIVNLEYPAIDAFNCIGKLISKILVKKL